MKDQIQVIAAKDYLSQHGPAAKMPVSAPIRQSNACAMKELRPGSSGRSEIRILYAFDRSRTAVLLLGGDKAERSKDWNTWYDRNVPVADGRFASHQAKTQVLARQDRAGGVRAMTPARDAVREGGRGR